MLDERFTRETLVTGFVEKIRDATERGVRMILGQDHQYSIPFALAKEIGLVTDDWLLALKQLACGSYHREAPPLEHARIFAKRFNEWLATRGLPPYFYSATKSQDYGIPSCDPRSGENGTTYRLCEKSPGIFGQGKPKPFNRVGDNGTVGGQTLVGLTRLVELIGTCHWENIPLKCWPFDGLDILSSAYEGAHVLVEPYPSATRSKGVVRSDAEDARASAHWTWATDRQGRLPRMLDLSGLMEQEQRMVLFEGWIAGHVPVSTVPDRGSPSNRRPPR